MSMKPHLCVWVYEYEAWPVCMSMEARYGLQHTATTNTTTTVTRAARVSSLNINCQHFNFKEESSVAADKESKVYL
jgi:hypothetical protein